MVNSNLVSLAFLAGAAQAGKLWSEVCTQADTKAMPFCDMSRPIDARVSDYVKRVSLTDKVRALGALFRSHRPVTPFSPQRLVPSPTTGHTHAPGVACCQPLCGVPCLPRLSIRCRSRNTTTMHTGGKRRGKQKG